MIEPLDFCPPPDPIIVNGIKVFPPLNCNGVNNAIPYINHTTFNNCLTIRNINSLNENNFKNKSDNLIKINKTIYWQSMNYYLKNTFFNNNRTYLLNRLKNFEKNNESKFNLNYYNNKLFKKDESDYGPDFKGFWNSCSYGQSESDSINKLYIGTDRGYVYNDICTMAKAMDNTNQSNQFSSYSDYFNDIQKKHLGF